MNADLNEHQRTWDLLPWIANGTADADQVRQADRHLRACATCRAELDREQCLRRGLRLPAEHAPDVELGLQRLLQRIDRVPAQRRPQNLLRRNSASKSPLRARNPGGSV